MEPHVGRFLSTRRRRERPLNGENCSVLRTDIAKFSSPARTDEHRRIIRQAHYEIVERGFEASGIPWDGCRYEDRGDGGLIVIRPEVSTELLINPLIDHLVAGLRRHNTHTEEATVFQLRAALHVGPVKSDLQGVNGRSSSMLPASWMRCHSSSI